MALSKEEKLKQIRDKRDKRVAKEREAEEKRAANLRESNIAKLDKEITKLEDKKRKFGQLTQKEEDDLYKSKKERLKYESKEFDTQKKESEKLWDEREKKLEEHIQGNHELFSLGSQLNDSILTSELKGREDIRDVNKEILDDVHTLADAELDIGKSTFQVKDYKDDIIASQNKLNNLESIAASTNDAELKKKIVAQIEVEKIRLEGLGTLDATSDKLKAQNKAITDGNARLKEMEQPLKDIQNKFDSWAVTLEGIATNPMVLLIAGIVMLGKHFAETEKAAEDFRKSMGLSIAASKELEQNAMAVAKNMGDVGVTFEDALGATESLVKEFGDLGIASEKNVETVMRMNKALGMTNDEAANFLNTISSIQGGSIETAEALAASTVNMARLAGVAPQAVISDMTANADSFAGYIKDGGKNMAEAAVFAAKMGASMEVLVGIADHLLDIESSTEAMMEAQVLTGRNINLEKARELALNGEIADMGAEILKQVGSEAEWNEMNKIQRDAIAKAMGMTTAEMGNMISKQETLKGLADGTLTTQEALAELPLSEVMDAKGITSGITDIKNSIQAIALNLMEVFRPVFSFIAMILKPIAWAIGLVAKLLNNPIAKGVLYMWMIWKLINSEIAFGMALKAKDAAISLARAIKDRTIAMAKFIFDKKNWSWKIAQEKLFGGLKKNLHNKEMARKKAEQLLDKKGFKSKISGLKDKLMGKGKGATAGGGMTPKTPDMPAAGAKGKGAGTFMESVGKIDMKKVLKGAAAMLIVAAAMFVFAKALQSFPTDPAPYIGAAVGMGILFGAIFILGKMQGEVMKGALAMLVMGAAFIPLAFGLSLITDLNFTAVGALAVALIVLTAAMVGLGALMMSGIGAAAFFLGAAALAVLGGALIIFGAGLMMVGSGLEKIVGSIGLLGEEMISLTESVDGTALLAVSASLVLFVMSLVPLMMIAPFVAWGVGLLGAAFVLLGTGLTLAGTGMQLIKDAFAGFGESIGEVTPALDEVIAPLSRFGLAVVSFGMFAAPASIGIFMLSGALMFFAGALTLVGGAAMLVNVALAGIKTSILELVAVYEGLFGLAAGLGAIAAGFVSLAFSLALMTPFIPLLMLLGASGVIGQILGVTEVAPVEDVEGGGEGKKKKELSETDIQLQTLNTKFDQLIAAVQEGGTVTLDGKKVGDALGSGLLGPLVG